MNQRYLAFLAVAEHLSIRKAAEESFVSYQCVNGHIRSLEEEYKVKLFERSPHFALTADGRTLQEALQKIRLIEDGIAQAFEDDGRDVAGHVSLGMPTSRFIALVPPLLKQFHALYPHVELEVTTAFSDDLQKQVEHGTLDMAVVVQQSATPNPKLDTTFLLREQYLFLASQPLLREVLGAECESCCRQYQKDGVAFADLARFPFVNYPQGSRLRAFLDEGFAAAGQECRTVFSSNRAETFDAIARTDVAGAVIPHQLYGITARANAPLKRENRLQAYRVRHEEINTSRDIYLIRNSSSVLAAYKQQLMQLIAGQFAGYDELVRRIR